MPTFSSNFKHAAVAFGLFFSRNRFFQFGLLDKVQLEEKGVCEFVVGSPHFSVNQEKTRSVICLVRSAICCMKQLLFVSTYSSFNVWFTVSGLDSFQSTFGLKLTSVSPPAATTLYFVVVPVPRFLGVLETER